MNVTTLKEKLQEKHMSVHRLALLSGISPSDLYGVLKGKKPLFPRWRKKICETLEITEESLLDEGEE